MVRCPKNGSPCPIRTRAKIGEGTQSAKRRKTLNQNQLAIGQILADLDRQLTVRQVQGILYEKRIKRQQRREKIPSGQWNYHNVQTDLSELRGLDVVTMTIAKEFYDEYGFGARPIPRYYMTELQKERFSKIKAGQGRL